MIKCCNCEIEFEVLESMKVWPAKIGSNWYCSYYCYQDRNGVE